MSVYTLQLRPDSLSGDYWVDLGNETHVELNRRQADRLLKFILSSGAIYEKGTEVHPESLALSETLSYNDSGQLDKVIGDEVQVLPGKGIISYKWLKAEFDKLLAEQLIGGKSRRRRSKKAKRSRRMR